MIPYNPKRILVQEEAWRDSATDAILKRLPGIEVRTVRDPDSRSLDADVLPGPHTLSKDTLILVRHPGKFLKRCQGSGADVCCNYFVASYAWNCHFQCTYCILQSYLSNEALVACTNIEDLLLDIKETLGRAPGRKFRIGTGELADSLALDHITAYSRLLVPFFAALPNGILELKTKSNQIANLADLDHGRRTILSWSVNSRRICRLEEQGTASFDERLEAAARCQAWGYRLGFHFDPIIYYDGWESEYRQAVDDIFHAIDPAGIAWISLGALRFPPRLREMVQRKFPGSIVPWGEFVPGHHGKERYFRPIREEIYRKMLSWIRARAPHVFVYLCMESHSVWERSCAGMDSRRLSDQLDSCCAPCQEG